jgi:hypothetical protein
LFPTDASASILAKFLPRQQHDIEAGSVVTELRDHRVWKYIFTKTHSTTTFAGTTTDAPGSCGRLPECTFPDSDAFTERFCLNILENAFKMMPLSVRFKWQLYFILCSCSVGMAFTEWALFTLFHKQNGRTMFHLHIYWKESGMTHGFRYFVPFPAEFFSNSDHCQIKLSKTL